MSKERMDSEKKLTITIEGMESGPKVFSEVSGCVMSFKHSFGWGRVMIGDLSIADLASMVKVLFSGNDEGAQKMKFARALASMTPDIDNDSMVEIENSESEKVNDPFQDLISGLKEEGKSHE